MTRGKKPCVLPFLLLALLALPRGAFSLEITPFDSTNQSPLAAIFGLPGPGNFLPLATGQTEIGLNVALTSNHSVHEILQEAIVLDGETTRFTLMVRHALSPRLAVGVKAPFIVQGGGFLDGFIENYHDAFGFPQGGRDQTPHNRLLYRYRRDGIDQVFMDASGSGPGDLRLTTAYQLYAEKEGSRGLSFNLGVKLPTGDSDELRGSGGTDVSLWLTGGADVGEAAGKWTAYGAAGVLYLTEGDILPAQQKNWVGFGSLGLGWAPLPRLALKVQADAHTPFFGDSGLKELADSSVQLIVGGTIGLGEKTTLDIGVGEDLVVSTSPDVVFYLTLRQNF